MFITVGLRTFLTTSHEILDYTLISENEKEKEKRSVQKNKQTVTLRQMTT